AVALYPRVARIGVRAGDVVPARDRVDVGHFARTVGGGVGQRRARDVGGVLGQERRLDHVFFFQAEDGIRDYKVTGVQTCALPILLFAGLELGCDGGVLAVACYAARRCADIFAAFRAGDRGRAGALQEQLGPLDKEIVGRLGPAGVKAAMDAVGLYGGPVRAPLASLAPADRERVAHLVCA